MPFNCRRRRAFQNLTSWPHICSDTLYTTILKSYIYFLTIQVRIGNTPIIKKKNKNVNIKWDNIGPKQNLISKGKTLKPEMPCLPLQAYESIICASKDIGSLAFPVKLPFTQQILHHISRFSVQKPYSYFYDYLRSSNIQFWITFGKLLWPF